MAARSSLLRRPTPGAHPARRTSSVVAALPALAPRLVRLARHGYSDRLLGVGAPEGEHGVGAAEAEGVGERGVDAGGPRLARDIMLVVGLVRLLLVVCEGPDAVRQRVFGVVCLDLARSSRLV